MSPSKKNRRLFAATFVMALIVCAIGTSLIRGPKGGITRANYDKIRLGMTQDDVEALLGCPPGDYTDGRPVMGIDSYGGSVLMREGVMKEWWDELGIIQVGFDNGGCVLWTRFVEVSTGPQTFIDRVKAWVDRVVLLRMPSSKNGSGFIAEPAML
jgi:hypothetical protein